jgi:para-aminobenzoate synthetase/4-amino-4-deoxychorismate lyase
MIAASMPEQAAATRESRPDRRHGVFETLLVVDGRPVELDAHLARLGASVRALYGLEAPDGLRDLVLSESRAGALGRLRVTVAPTREGGLAPHAVGAAVDPGDVFPAGSRAASLETMRAESGLGEHKWADRELLERAEAVGPPGAVPLLLAADGSVLEASRANVFAVVDGGLLTPPLDGRILPGVTRARLIEIAGERGITVNQERLGLERLLGAEEILLSGSVRGIEPVAALDGVEVARPERMVRLLAGELRRRWLGG